VKLLVFAHTPPPHHGQSYMVKLMLDGFGGDRRQAKGARMAPERVREISERLGFGAWDYEPIECYHVNSRFSEDLEDIGAFRIGKALLVLRYCLEAIWCRFRYGIDAFYYVPAPGKRAALYRDWIVMLLCRPFFRHIIHHWHAAGLGDWLAREGTRFERWLTHRLLGRPRLGVSVAILSMRDALWFRSRTAEVVWNGIPDPFPDFDESLLPRRQARAAARRALLSGAPADAQSDGRTFRVLFLSNCLREKGLFDTLEGVLMANAMLARNGSPIRLHLTVAGGFLHEGDEQQFRARIEAPDARETVRYAGFVSGSEKNALLRDCDLLCFPSYYEAESFGLVVVEAMAAGMGIIATRWRGLAEALPPDYDGFVPPRSPLAVAEALVAALTRDDAPGMRAYFLEHFVLSRYLAALREIFLRARSPQGAVAPYRGHP
jgi:glycosyltransferase involved in cell wall biosynthesis